MKLFDYEAYVDAVKSKQKDTDRGYQNQEQVTQQKWQPDDNMHKHPHGWDRNHNKGHDRHNMYKPNDDRVPGGPPPNKKPKYSKSPGVYAVDHRTIGGCMYHYTYVWLVNGRSFWFYPTFVGKNSISGYRWSRFGWSYIGLDLELIDFFSCTGL